MFTFLTKYRPGYAPAIGWFILCTLLLCLPGSRFPKYNWLSEIQFDKWVHVGLFSLLVLFLCWGFWSRSTGSTNFLKPFLLFSVVATAYGIGMEYVQENFVANRSFDVGDIWADAAGAGIGGWFSGWRFGKK
jgi:hypothetical protein